MKIIVMIETDEGEAECRGDTYSNLMIFDADKLCELSLKYLSDNKVIEKIIEEEGGFYEDYIEKDKPFDFFDFVEFTDFEKLISKIAGYRNNYEFEYKTYDISKEKELRSFCIDLYYHNKADSNFSLGLKKDVLLKFFNEEELKSVEITNKFNTSITTVTNIDVSFNDKNIGSTILN